MPSPSCGSCYTAVVLSSRHLRLGRAPPPPPLGPAAPPPIAINDGEKSKTHWEPLAPTKEAQEFRLTQMYQDGLLQQQSGEYVNAQNLFQAIIQDPLWMEIEATNFNVSNPMVRLRYLTLKNLGEAYFKQGSKYHNDALKCYLQAATIDGKDVVLWNRLGTLAFSLGIFNIARRAFEIGLHCSPNHWGCMEKIMEVLIAIRDETACLAVAKQLLKVSPSHPRAELVRHVLEGNVDGCKVEFLPASPTIEFLSPCGIDKLEPQFCSFPSLEKVREDHLQERDISLKQRTFHNVKIHVAEASWAALIHSLTSYLKVQEGSTLPISKGNCLTALVNKCDDTPRTCIRNVCISFSIGEYNSQGVGIRLSEMDNIEAGSSPDTANYTHAEKEQVEPFDSTSLSLCFDPEISNIKVSGWLEDSHVDKRQKLCIVEGLPVGNEGCSERNYTLKDRDVSTDDEPHYLERRSTRLENLRTRKFERNEELEGMQSDIMKAKLSCKMLRESLEPFIVCYENIKKIPGFLSDTTEFEKTRNQSDEENEVMQFLKEHASNSGIYHIAGDLLERISFGTSNFIGSVMEIAEIEKLTRNCVHEKSASCNLFLAEVYMDLAGCAAEKKEMITFLQDCEYNLCRVFESVASKLPSHVITWDKEHPAFSFPGNENADLKGSKWPANQPDIAVPQHCWSFWLRYYWLSGCVRYATGNHEGAKDDFKRCLGILNGEEQADSRSISLRHCRTDNEINADRIYHKLHVLQVEDLLHHSAVKMLEQRQYADLIKLLLPIFLGKECSGEKHLSIFNRKHAMELSAELNVLNMLITACENSMPIEYVVALQCYAWRLEIYCAAAGFLDSNIGLAHNFMQGGLFLMSEQIQDASGGWFKMVTHEIKLVSRCAAHLCEVNHESLFSKVPDGTSLGHLQQLMLTIMCHISAIICAKGCSGLAISDLQYQSEAACFVDAAVTFCRLQHLYPATSMEQQVELLVTMHDVLATHGLCCAGKASEGGEGAFLKMAIKHLLSLEMKLKTSTFTYSDKEQVEYNAAEDRSLVGMPLSQKDRGEVKTKLRIECNVKATEVVCCSQESGKAENDMSSAENNAIGSEKVPIQRRKKVQGSPDPDGQATTKKKEQLSLYGALDQSFFCLYGLNLRSGLEPTSQDDLAVHSNTNLGDYETKEQCADVFHYLLPYAKVSSRASLLKLRKVLRAIWKQFPEPPASILRNNVIDKFLDDLDFDEDRFRDMVLCGQSVREIFKFMSWSNLKDLRDDSGNVTKPVFILSYTSNIPSDSESSVGALDNPDSSSPFFEVYSNLYYLLTHVEEISAGDKWPGFVFSKEGEDFVEQNVNLFKYDLLYNPLHFESWQRLANLYDEEVDLMLNDGSKTCNPALWQKNISWPGRVDCGRRHSRRCLLMSLALATTPEQQSQAHELLALVYYDALQNVVPSYDQRLHVPNRDSIWKRVCQNSLNHFEKAFTYKPEWSHSFYMGKLAAKAGHQCEVSLQYYKNAADMNPYAVDPLYRIHASRLKLLCAGGRENLNVIQVVARFCYLPSNEEKVSKLLGDIKLSLSTKSTSFESSEKVSEHCSNKYHQNSGVKEAWQCLFEDCVKALEACLEGELKHFHKARFRLAQGLLMRNENDDIERAKDELAFCFKSNRSLFTINMWEIDGSTKRNKRKAPGAPGCRRGLELSMPESSRKFITCLRKYLLLYLYLCEKTIDVCTLERAYSSLRVDKKFSLCLADLINVAYGKYIYTLAVAIHQTRISDGNSSSNLKSLLERFFSSFMEHGSSWPDMLALSLGEASLSSAPEVSESALYGYIHQYIYSLEADNRIDALEPLNERVRKRFKNFKLVNSHCDLVYKHAVLSWCRSLCSALSDITPQDFESRNEASYSDNADQDSQLYVELCSDELLTNPYETYCSYLSIENLKHSNQARSMRGIWIRQASEENMEKALVLLKQCHTFYRDCSGPFPFGVNLFMRSSMHIHSSTEWGAKSLTFSGPLVSMDLSVPRKLLLWAYTLVHGRTCSISEAVKVCEDQAKSKMKRRALMVDSLSSLNNSQAKTVPSGFMQLVKESPIADKDNLVADEHENAGNEMLHSVCNVYSCNSPSASSKQILIELNQTDECYSVHMTEH